jgi:hypothetical protein
VVPSGVAGMRTRTVDAPRHRPGRRLSLVAGVPVGGRKNGERPRGSAAVGNLERERRLRRPRRRQRRHRRTLSRRASLAESAASITTWRSSRHASASPHPSAVVRRPCRPIGTGGDLDRFRGLRPPDADGRQRDEIARHSARPAGARSRGQSLPTSNHDATGAGVQRIGK